MRRSRISVRPNVRPGGRGSAPAPDGQSSQGTMAVDTEAKNSVSTSSPPPELPVEQPAEAAGLNNAAHTPAETSPPDREVGVPSSGGSVPATALQRRKRISATPNLARPKVTPAHPRSSTGAPGSPPPKLAKVTSPTCTPAPSAGTQAPSADPALVEINAGSLQNSRSPDRQRASTVGKQANKGDQIQEASPGLPTTSSRSLSPAHREKSVKEQPPTLRCSQVSGLPKSSLESTPHKSTDQGPNQSPPFVKLSRVDGPGSPLRASSFSSDRLRIMKTLRLKELMKEEIRKERMGNGRPRKCEHSIVLDRRTMTMRDLIYYLPENNPMTGCRELSLSSQGTQLEHSQIKSTNHANSNRTSLVQEQNEVENVIPPSPRCPVKMPEEVEEEEEDYEEPEKDEDMLVPKIKVAEDGTLILDEESLTVRVQRGNGTVIEDSSPLFERGSTTTYMSFRTHHRVKQWSLKETDMFFLAISMVGTDFSLISQLFPHRGRAEIKNKFKREEKSNSWRVDKAFRNKRPFDSEFFISLLERILAKDRQKKDRPKATLRKPRKPKARKGKVSAKNDDGKDGIVVEDCDVAEDDSVDAEKENEDNNSNVSAATKKKRKRTRRVEEEEASAEEPAKGNKKSKKSKKTKKAKGDDEDECDKEGDTAEGHSVDAEKENEDDNSNVSAATKKKRKRTRRVEEEEASAEEPAKGNKKSKKPKKDKPSVRGGDEDEGVPIDEETDVVEGDSVIAEKGKDDETEDNSAAAKKKRPREKKGKKKKEEREAPTEEPVRGAKKSKKSKKSKKTHEGLVDEVSACENTEGEVSMEKQEGSEMVTEEVPKKPSRRHSMKPAPALGKRAAKRIPEPEPVTGMDGRTPEQQVEDDNGSVSKGGDDSDAAGDEMLQRRAVVVLTPVQVEGSPPALQEEQPEPVAIQEETLRRSPRARGIPGCSRVQQHKEPLPSESPVASPPTEEDSPRPHSRRQRAEKPTPDMAAAQWKRSVAKPERRGATEENVTPAVLPERTHSPGALEVEEEEEESMEEGSLINFSWLYESEDQMLQRRPVVVLTREEVDRDPSKVQQRTDDPPPSKTPPTCSPTKTHSPGRQRRTAEKLQPDTMAARREGFLAKHKVWHESEGTPSGVLEDLVAQASQDVEAEESIGESPIDFSSLYESQGTPSSQNNSTEEEEVTEPPTALQDKEIAQPPDPTCWTPMENEGHGSGPTSTSADRAPCSPEPSQSVAPELPVTVASETVMENALVPVTAGSVDMPTEPEHPEVLPPPGIKESLKPQEDATPTCAEESPDGASDCSVQSFGPKSRSRFLKPKPNLGRASRSPRTHQSQKTTVPSQAVCLGKMLPQSPVKEAGSHIQSFIVETKQKENLTVKDPANAKESLNYASPHKTLQPPTTRSTAEHDTAESLTGVINSSNATLAATEEEQHVSPDALRTVGDESVTPSTHSSSGANHTIPMCETVAEDAGNADPCCEVLSPFASPQSLQKDVMGQERMACVADASQDVRSTQVEGDTTAESELLAIDLTQEEPTFILTLYAIPMSQSDIESGSVDPPRAEVHSPLLFSDESQSLSIESEDTSCDLQSVAPAVTETGCEVSHMVLSDPLVPVSGELEGGVEMDWTTPPNSSSQVKHSDEDTVTRHPDRQGALSAAAGTQEQLETPGVLDTGTGGACEGATWPQERRAPIRRRGKLQVKPNVSRKTGTKVESTKTDDAELEPEQPNPAQTMPQKAQRTQTSRHESVEKESLSQGTTDHSWQPVAPAVIETGCEVSHMVLNDPLVPVSGELEGGVEMDWTTPPKSSSQVKNSDEDSVTRPPDRQGAMSAAAGTQEQEMETPGVLDTGTGGAGEGETSSQERRAPTRRRGKLQVKPNVSKNTRTKVESTKTDDAELEPEQPNPAQAASLGCDLQPVAPEGIETGCEVSHMVLSDPLVLVSGALEGGVEMDWTTPPKSSSQAEISDEDTVTRSPDRQGALSAAPGTQEQEMETPGVLDTGTGGAGEGETLLQERRAPTRRRGKLQVKPNVSRKTGTKVESTKTDDAELEPEQPNPAQTMPQKAQRTQTSRHESVEKESLSQGTTDHSWQPVAPAVIETGCEVSHMVLSDPLVPVSGELEGGVEMDWTTPPKSSSQVKNSDEDSVTSPPDRQGAMSAAAGTQEQEMETPGVLDTGTGGVGEGETSSQERRAPTRRRGKLQVKPNVSKNTRTKVESTKTDDAELEPEQPNPAQAASLGCDLQPVAPEGIETGCEVSHMVLSDPLVLVSGALEGGVEMDWTTPPKNSSQQEQWMQTPGVLDTGTGGSGEGATSSQERRAPTRRRGKLQVKPNVSKKTGAKSESTKTDDVALEPERPNPAQFVPEKSQRTLTSQHESVEKESPPQDLSQGTTDHSWQPVAPAVIETGCEVSHMVLSDPLVPVSGELEGGVEMDWTTPPKSSSQVKNSDEDSVSRPPDRQGALSAAAGTQERGIQTPGVLDTGTGGAGEGATWPQERRASTRRSGKLQMKPNVSKNTRTKVESTKTDDAELEPEQPNPAQTVSLSCDLQPVAPEGIETGCAISHMVLSDPLVPVSGELEGGVAMDWTTPPKSSSQQEQEMETPGVLDTGTGGAGEGETSSQERRAPTRRRGKLQVKPNVSKKMVAKVESTKTGYAGLEPEQPNQSQTMPQKAQQSPTSRHECMEKESPLQELSQGTKGHKDSPMMDGISEGYQLQPRHQSTPMTLRSGFTGSGRKPRGFLSLLASGSSPGSLTAPRTGRAVTQRARVSIPHRARTTNSATADPSSDSSTPNTPPSKIVTRASPCGTPAKLMHSQVFQSPLSSSPISSVDPEDEPTKVSQFFLSDIFTEVEDAE